MAFKLCSFLLWLTKDLSLIIHPAYIFFLHLLFPALSLHLSTPTKAPPLSIQTHRLLLILQLFWTTNLFSIHSRKHRGGVSVSSAGETASTHSLDFPHIFREKHGERQKDGLINIVFPNGPSLSAFASASLFCLQ